jgi:hypothetical protein
MGMHGPHDAQPFAYIGLKWRKAMCRTWTSGTIPPASCECSGLPPAPQELYRLGLPEGVFILGCIAMMYGLARRWGRRGRPP